MQKMKKLLKHEIKDITWQDVMEMAKNQNNIVGSKILITKSKCKKLAREFNNDQQEKWRNDIYTATVRKLKPKEHGFTGIEITEISISRLDGKAVHDWRHIQWLKNDVVGTEIDAIEMYPKESKLVDTANQYWLYAFTQGLDFPLVPKGFTTRVVSDKINSNSTVNQRPGSIRN
tara:strand:+ start:335 stop:856 length:522 start_codon:yes stop_codon:yes gene_type:complete